jgi:hypothetical protein
LFATWSKDFLAQSDWVKPDRFTAVSIGFRSSGVKRTEMPGARALALATLGRPAFGLIKINDVIQK